MIEHRIVKPISLAIVLAASLGRMAGALEITAANVSVNAGSTASVNVIWSSVTPLDYLTTEFILTAVAGSPDGEASFANIPIDGTTGTPTMPPLSNSNYVFFGDSFDLITFPTNNPASVSTTNWNYDTYNFADSTKSGTDYAQSGSRLWTILQINASALASGSYQITLGNSQYQNLANPSGLVPTLTGGLITIVPEPGTWALAAIATTILATIASRRRARMNR